MGKVLGRTGVDVAILQVEGLSLPSLTITETLKAGSLVAVVGMTSDVGPSFSLGTIGGLGPQRRTWKIGLLDHFIRLDVTLYPSQIGAVVVDTEGHLIGMATPALSRHSYRDSGGPLFSRWQWRRKMAAFAPATSAWAFNQSLSLNIFRPRFPGRQRLD